MQAAQSCSILCVACLENGKYKELWIVAWDSVKSYQFSEKQLDWFLTILS